MSWRELYSVTIKGDHVQDILRRMRERLSNMRPIAPAISGIVRESVARNFAAGGIPPWAPPKKPQNHPLLVDTGKLRSRAMATTATVTDNKVTITSDVGTYGMVHQFGSKGGVGLRPAWWTPDRTARTFWKARGVTLADKYPVWTKFQAKGKGPKNWAIVTNKGQHMSVTSRSIRHVGKHDAAAWKQAVAGRRTPARPYIFITPGDEKRITQAIEKNLVTE